MFYFKGSVFEDCLISAIFPCKPICLILKKKINTPLILGCTALQMYRELKYHGETK